MSTPDWLTELRVKAKAAKTEDGYREFMLAANPQTVLWLLDILQLEAEHYDPGVWAEYEAGPGQGDGT